ncbi:MAG: AbrB/MazE/SpoVT family DNA-binding domain-containing protein [Clostridia bacterium]|nr:AbrB/MazE/SpoVT family DNA-binding domain-containing protein [Clostridia bacterium]
MKATGIVRRIDDLGRVVIPKEIRRTMRIREGDPLEIYTDANGEVIFKKYSPIGELSEFSGQYAEVLSRSMQLAVLVCDRDHCISASGIPKKEMLDRRVSSQLEEYMEMRRSYIAHINDAKKMSPVEGTDRVASAAFPIIASGDVVGAIVLLLPESGAFPGEVELKLCEVAASFLGKQMEE